MITLPLLLPGRDHSISTVVWNGGVAVVDDEASLADLIVTMLELKRIPVCFKAYDGREAVQKFRECNPKPEIVIIDYGLPSTSGIQVMKRRGISITG